MKIYNVNEFPKGSKNPSGLMLLIPYVRYMNDMDEIRKVCIKKGQDLNTPKPKFT